ncbi:MAG TPA: ABC transporter permease [Solirubrobacteraceae bacterium]|nr:ABC transporter permease [Solirubrobacteraceae bacterium]
MTAVGIGAGRARGVLRRLGHELARNPTLTVGAVVLAIVVVVAIFAPLLAPDPTDAGNATHPLSVLQAPSSAHPFGTDELGRDLLTRVMYGGRTSLQIVVEVLAIAAAIGIPLGLIAGYFGGAVDQVIMRVTDIFLAFPALLLSLAIASVFTPSVGHMILAIAVTWWPWYTRLVRGEAASVVRRPYVESSRTLGVSHARIVARHVLPNAATPVLVQISMDAGGVLLVSAAISFLGLGAQDPTPEWGLMVSQGASYFSTQWWYATFPGIAILITAMAFNLIGDGLRERLDPKRVLSR